MSRWRLADIGDFDSILVGAALSAYLWVFCLDLAVYVLQLSHHPSNIHPIIQVSNNLYTARMFNHFENMGRTEDCQGFQGVEVSF